MWGEGSGVSHVGEGSGGGSCRYPKSGNLIVNYCKLHHVLIYFLHVRSCEVVLITTTMYYIM